MVQKVLLCDRLAGRRYFRRAADGCPIRYRHDHRHGDGCLGSRCVTCSITVTNVGTGIQKTSRAIRAVISLRPHCHYGTYVVATRATGFAESRSQPVSAQRGRDDKLNLTLGGGGVAGKRSSQRYGDDSGYLNEHVWHNVGLKSGPESAHQRT